MKILPELHQGPVINDREVCGGGGGGGGGGASEDLRLEKERGWEECHVEGGGGEFWGSFFKPY